MGWLKGLFGSDKSRPSDSSARAAREIDDVRSRMEPFEYVSSGLEAWEAGDQERAERLLRQGVDAYRRAEPDGVDFALGRLGAYLLDQARVDEATEVLDEAITRGTDLPAIWRDSLDIRARRQDLDGLFDIATRWQASAHGPEQPWAGLIAHARGADRAGDSEFAIAVADRVAAGAARAGDQQAAWSAIGVLGHIHERAGHLDRALDLWTVAFAEGSDDPTTLNRLSMHRERARDYAGAIAVIEIALERHLPANTAEQLRKRLERCRARAEGRGRRDVTAYSVRTGEGAFEPVFQSRVSPPIRSAHVQGAMARCFGVSKRVGTIVDVSLADGSEVGRHTDLPAFGDLLFSPKGYGIGAVQTGRVGSAETTLTFLSPDSIAVATGRVPDAVSEIAAIGDLWCVGCRDGHLYAFAQTGEPLWRWETPGSRDHDGDAYSRPCPYYVAADGERAVVSSMGDIYCIGATGTTLWHFQLPHEEMVQDGELLDLSTGDADEDDGLGFEFSITFDGMSPMVSSLVAGADAILVGSSDGRLFVLSPAGELRGVHQVGESWVHPVVDAQGASVAAYSSETLFRWGSGRFRHVTEAAGAPEGVGAWSGGLYVWSRKQLDVLSWTGQVIWGVEFSKNISSAVMHERRLVCAAGVPVTFALAGEPID